MSSRPEGQLSVCTRRCHQQGPGVGLSDVCVPAPSPPWVGNVSFYIATRKHKKTRCLLSDAVQPGVSCNGMIIFFKSDSIRDVFLSPVAQRGSTAVT